MADIREITPLHPTWPVRPLDPSGERRQQQPPPRPKQPPAQERHDDDEDDQHIDDYA